MSRTLVRTLVLAAAISPPGAVIAQQQIVGKVDIAFNRYYSHDELNAHLHAIAKAYPDLVTVKMLGHSRQGREMWLAIVNNPKTGEHSSKPAMWIDGNVHGNEIQAAEVVLYTLWSLTKAHGKNPALTRIVDENVFYLLISVNPDGRANWFEAPNDPNSSRHSMKPVDNDRDGLFDEDPPDDLDGDGSITRMWLPDPEGRYVRNRYDPRIFELAPPGQKGDWTPLGSEGIDNDGDGRINEDGPGGDDMNRDWPGGWQPDYVQGFAGVYPLSSPETRPVGLFILSQPNIAAAQSYHNAGGMILRGPGTPTRESWYPGADVAVYNVIQDMGEKLLPYYRKMVIHSDLYIVHGGFVNWVAETLGIISFTNELWTDAKFYQRDGAGPADGEWVWRDHMVFGETFKDYTEFDHPRYGKVLVGGPNKWSARVTPPFLLEEECHRNFAFTMFHADQMPKVRFDRLEIDRIGDRLWSLTLEIENDKAIPTRTAVARQKRIGSPDLLTCRVEGGTVVTAGRLNAWTDERMDPVRREPGRLVVSEGIPGKGRRIFRWIVNGEPSSRVEIRYEGQKIKDIDLAFTLEESP